jgi:hypothetical protein
MGSWLIRTLRARRYRRCHQGDHSLCRHGPWPVRSWSAAEVEGLDVARAMQELAARLAAAHEADSRSAPLARELRATLLAMAGLAPAESDDPLAELRALMGPSGRSPVGHLSGLDQCAVAVPICLAGTRGRRGKQGGGMGDVAAVEAAMREGMSDAGMECRSLILRCRQTSCPHHSAGSKSS